jgi:hypothetical protein
LSHRLLVVLALTAAGTETLLTGAVVEIKVGLACGLGVELGDSVGVAVARVAWTARVMATDV